MELTPSRLRSRLSREILRILALQVAGPIATAELFELIRVTVAASRSLSCFLSATNGPKNFIHQYLYRLSEQGFIEIAGHQRKKQVLLTSKGRHFLEKVQEEEQRKSYHPPKVDEEELKRRIEPIPDEIINQKTLTEKRKKWYKKSRRNPSIAFLSYDIPERWSQRRDWLRERLQNLGFERFHHSFYIGTVNLIRKIVEEAETWGLVPYLCWGRLEVMPG